MIRCGILSDLATSVFTASNRGDMVTLLRRIWANSRRPQDLAVAAAVTGVALARAGRHSFAAPRTAVLREA
jgi:hypothetical protein